MENKYKRHVKLSDKFWKENLLKILECLYWEEGTWLTDYWQKYGISISDRKKIESEFDRRMNEKLKNII